MHLTHLEKSSLPFLKTKNQILLVSDKAYPWFYSLLDEINSSASINGSPYIKNPLDFISDIGIVTPGYLQYALPGVKDSKELLHFLERIDIGDISTFLLQYLGFKKNPKPGFLVPLNNSIAYLQPGEISEIAFKETYGKLDKIIAENPYVYYGEPRFKRVSCEPEDADDAFDYYGQLVDKEILRKIASIEKPEICQFLIRVLQDKLKRSNEINTLLSPLAITSDYRIILTGFHNREVNLTPLCKAIYLLFLHHEDGIMFSHLPDYKTELLEIYKQLAYRESWENMLVSVHDLTDPLSNSINEKCSRIKSAFVEIMDKELAEYYFITGNRGEPKKILLDRKLITWNVK